jgi:hypothetical protein
MDRKTGRRNGDAERESDSRARAATLRQAEGLPPMDEEQWLFCLELAELADGMAVLGV